MENLLCGKDASGYFQAFVITICVIGAYKFLIFVISNILACLTLCCRGK